MEAPGSSAAAGQTRSTPAGIDEAGLRVRVAQALDRWPSAGLAAAVVRDGSLVWFLGHGAADAESAAPVTQHTVFRVGSITKTFTAIAVLQLWERGLVDLDAPASDYLRSFRLVPARAEFAPVTVRHLLTHTAGIGYWRRLTDLLQPAAGAGDRAGRAGALPLPGYYRRGLPVEVEPGTKWVYSNHGFAALGQIVEDVSGEPIGGYLREHVFAPLGMDHTDLTRSGRVRPHLATGYVLRSGGLRAVADREVPTPAAGGAYSTTADLARYLAALARMGTGEHGQVLQPATLASMFEPHYQPDPRLPGMGLGFLLGDEDGHHTVGHTGVVAGFLSAMVLAPGDGAGVVVLANTGGLSGRGAPERLTAVLLRHLLGLPDETIRTGIPPRPANWASLCGWYSPDPGPVTNLFTRALMGAGAEVTVRGGQLLLRPLTPVPALRRGLRLYPADPRDPQVFQADFSPLGFGTLRVVFTGAPGAGGTGTRLLMEEMSFRKRPGIRNPRRWVNGALAAGAAALAAGGLRAWQGSRRA